MKLRRAVKRVRHALNISRKHQWGFLDCPLCFKANRD